MASALALLRSSRTPMRTQAAQGHRRVVGRYHLAELLRGLPKLRVPAEDAALAEPIIRSECPPTCLVSACTDDVATMFEAPAKPSEPAQVLSMSDAGAMRPGRRRERRYVAHFHRQAARIFKQDRAGALAEHRGKAVMVERIEEARLDARIA